jgi:hypothetical protein
MSETRPTRGRRIFLAAAIAVCLLLAGLAGYRAVEHAVFRAQLRRMNRRIAVLQQRLDRDENLLKLLDDSSLTSFADSLKSAAPDTVPR